MTTQSKAALAVPRGSFSRKAFTAFHLLFISIPLITGAMDLFAGTALLAPSLDRSADGFLMLESNYRYLSGFWLGTALLLLWALRDVAARARVIELLWVMVFLGGLGRLVSWITVGQPPPPFIGFMAFELLGAPLFVLWLRRTWPGAGHE
jgi:hypothetical protein